MLTDQQSSSLAAKKLEWKVPLAIMSAIANLSQMLEFDFLFWLFISDVCGGNGGV